MIKAIIFDYDGVIVDSFPTVHRAYLKVLKDKVSKSFKEFKKTYGFSSRTFLRDLGLSAKEIRSVDTKFKKEILQSKAPMYPGVVELLEELNKNYTLTLVTGHYSSHVNKRLSDLSIKKYFKHIIAKGQSAGPLRKRQGFLDMLNKLGLKPSQVIVLGDRSIDYERAREAGIDNIILVDYGWGFNRKNVPQYNLKTKVKRPKDILAGIKEISKKKN